MPKIRYISKRFQLASRKLIKNCNAIIEDYASQGFDLTLRQLFYQLVTKNVILNNQNEYKSLVKLVSDARLAGLVDWSSIVDTTRFLRRHSHWNSPKEIISDCASSFRLDRWSDQTYRPEVWIEKDALIRVVESIVSPLDVPCISCRGYSSISELWSSAQRLDYYLSNNQIPYIIHIGDHDPSGIDMTRDIECRVNLMLSGKVSIKRLALNMPQIEELKPPPNTAKVADSRYPGYLKKFGSKCWELDSIPPSILSSIITKEVYSIMDRDKYSKMVKLEDQYKSTLSEINNRFSTIQKWVAMKGSKS